MDYFAHGFWSYILFHKTKKPLYAVLIGLMPDTFSWGIYMIYLLATGGFVAGPPNVTLIPDWVFTLYGITHSLVIAGLVILIFYLFMKKFPVYILAWPAVITMDLFTHTKYFLPTPILWPISDWVFPGISWGNGPFMIINYTLIIAFMIWIFRKPITNKTKTYLNILFHK